MKQEFRVVVSSPYGKQPIEQFRHFINKVADDALTRWGIEVQIQAVSSEDQPDVDNAFNGEENG